MKKNTGNTKKRTGLVLLAMTVPLTTFGVSLFTDIRVSGYGEFTATSGMITSSYNSVSVGFANVINNSQSSMAVGGALTADGVDNFLVVGLYNEHVPDAHFVVGNGTSQKRENAIEVYNNGDVIIPKRQGDIPMGIYGEVE